MDVALLGEVKELLSVYGGGIKSIQRGFVVFYNVEDAAKTISISKIDPDKSVLILNTYDGSTNNPTGISRSDGFKVSLSENKITIELQRFQGAQSWTNGRAIAVNWQVVEHY